MAVVRVIPYAYPTIEGQSTNESGGSGDGTEVQYMDLRGVSIDVHFANGSGGWVQNPGETAIYVKSTISNWKVNYMANNSFIEHFHMYYKIKGKTYDYRISIPVDTSASNTSREEKQQMQFFLDAEGNKGPVTTKLESGMICGVEVKMQVVNGAGMILQEKTVTDQVEIA